MKQYNVAEISPSEELDWSKLDKEITPHVVCNNWEIKNLVCLQSIF
jgi:hypothetical protein